MCEAIDLSFEVEVVAVVTVPVSIVRLTLSDECRNFLFQFRFLLFYLEAADLFLFGGQLCERVSSVRL
jgi:hypothetical protein